MTVPQVQRVSAEDFNRLSPGEKRVLIAKDALQLIELSLLVPNPGMYVARYVDVGFHDTTTQLHEVFDIMLEGVDPDYDDSACHVCALGASLVAAVRRFNDFPARLVSGGVLRAEGRPVLTRYLERFFDRDQLYLMEYAFEGHENRNMEEDRVKEGRRIFRASVFYKTYHDPHLRIVAIFKNIIDNYGEFIP